jgi:integrase
VSIIRQGGTANTGVNTVKAKGKESKINAHQITRAMRAAATEIDESRLGFAPSELTPHGLRAGGATAMLYRKFPLGDIEVRGRWTRGSQALSSYLSTFWRTDQPCFTENWGGVIG